MRAARAGFAQLTARRLRALRVQVRRTSTGDFAEFDRIELGYDLSPITGLSRLRSVTRTGTHEDGPTATWPTLGFSYAAPAIGDADAVVGPPRPVAGVAGPDAGGPRRGRAPGRPGEHHAGVVAVAEPGGRVVRAAGADRGPAARLREAGVFLSDFQGEGFADLITPEGFYPNEGAGFGGFRRFGVRPSFDLEDAATRFVDLDGDGVGDVLAMAGTTLYTFLLTPGEGFSTVARRSARASALDRPVDAPRRHRRGRAPGPGPPLARRCGGLAEPGARELRGDASDRAPGEPAGRRTAGAPDPCRRHGDRRGGPRGPAGAGDSDLRQRVRRAVRGAADDPLPGAAERRDDRAGPTFLARGCAASFSPTSARGPSTSCGKRRNRTSSRVSTTGWVRRPRSGTDCPRATPLGIGRTRGRGPFRCHTPCRLFTRVTTTDAVSGMEVTQRFAYHEGYHDAKEREFRGFAEVEQWDTEEDVTDSATSIPSRTVRFFDVGNGGRLVSRYFPVPTSLPDDAIANHAGARRALRGMLVREEVYGEDGTGQARVPYAVTQHAYTVTRVVGPPSGGEAKLLRGADRDPGRSHRARRRSAHPADHDDLRHPRTRHRGAGTGGRPARQLHDRPRDPADGEPGTAHANELAHAR